ncbi:MAG TPA: SDR family oxidoreductase [Longimicrobium sp.]
MAEAFRENVVILTGASDGIGREMALQLADQGAWLALAARDASKLEAVAAECRARGGRAVAVPTDVADEARCRALVERTVAEYGRVDTLVNNAGISMWARLDEVADLAPFQRMMQVNYFGSLYCTHAALPHLRARGAGWVINISSLAGRNPFAGGAAYCASKAALNSFSESLMLEVRHDNIRVSTIMPGSVATGFGGPGGSGDGDWKIAPQDIADIVLDLVTFPQRSLPSRIEIRPSRPPRK